MKSAFGSNVIEIREEMTCEEILEMDKYVIYETEHHELKEIVEIFLKLPD